MIAERFCAVASSDRTIFAPCPLGFPAARFAISLTVRGCSLALVSGEGLKEAWVLRRFQRETA